MYYQAYLQFLSKLKREIKISFYVGQTELYIDCGFEKEAWQISTKIFDGHGSIPIGIKECLSSLNHFRWQTESPALKANLDTGIVMLSQKIHPITDYKAFEALIKTFLEFETLWKEFLCEFGKKEPLSV